MHTSTSSSLITIFGGSGFIGRHTIRALGHDGWRIRSASRRPEIAGHLQPMGGVGQIHAIQANLRHPSSIADAVTGAQIVINAVGILANTGKQTFQSVQDEGARAVAKAARQAGAQKLIHISAIGADRESTSQYARSKAAGETGVLQEFPGAHILRPSIVFGPEDQFFNRFAGMARISPFLPLIGGGQTKFQPIYVGDVAASVRALVLGFGKPNGIYEIGGPETFTFRELLERTLKFIDRRRIFLNLPFWAAKVLSILTAPLPHSLQPVTLDQIRLLEKDNIVSASAHAEGRTLTDLDIHNPRSIDVIVPEYLEKFRSKGQYSHYRS